MSAATTAIDTPERAGAMTNSPVAAATVIFAGTMVALNAAGNAVPASDTAALKVVGRAEADVDNSAGAIGDKTVNAKAGCFRYSNSGTNAATKANIGGKAYAEDDNTVGTAIGTNAIVAGEIVDVDADGVWVKITADVVPLTLAVTAATAATANGSDAGTTQALANALKTAVNALIADNAATKALLVKQGLAK